MWWISTFSPSTGHDYHADEYINLSLNFFGKYTRKK